MEADVFNNIEQLENGTPTDKIIVLKSVFKQGKTTLNPVQDGNGWYKGVPRLSARDKEGLTHWAEWNSKCVIKEGTTFNLNDEAQKITWEWVKHAPCICKTKDEVQHTPGAEFYIHLENEEAKNNISRHEMKFLAAKYIVEDNSANYPMRAELLGINMDGESPLVIKEYLLDQAASLPDKVIEIYTSKSISTKLLLLKAMKRNVIRMGDGGLYMYGTNVLGTTETSAINWLSSPENVELVKVLEREVDPSYYSKVTDVAQSTTTPQEPAPRS